MRTEFRTTPERGVGAKFGVSTERSVTSRCCTASERDLSAKFGKIIERCTTPECDLSAKFGMITEFRTTPEHGVTVERVANIELAMLTGSFRRGVC